MKILDGHPSPLIKKFVWMVIIGVLLLISGICVSIILNDFYMVVLSVLVCIFSILKAFFLYRTISKNEYETVRGVCVSVSTFAIRKQRKVKIMDQDGNETMLLLDKNSKVKIGEEYCFYFKKTKSVNIGNEYLDSVLSSDCFLGYEATGKSIS